MGKVLIIEDDNLIAKIYSTRLSQDGYEVKVADNGKDGLGLIKTFKPNVVLLDIMIPKISGLEILKIIKKDAHTKNIPIIVYSNLGKDDGIKQAKALGASEYIIKANLTPHQVVEKIKSYLK